MPASGSVSQPHICRQVSGNVNEFADLRAFVEHHAAGDQFTYVLLSEEVANKSEFVPVNLPSDVDVTVQWDADGPMRPPNPNTRSTGMDIIDPNQFDQDNRERRTPDTVGQDEHGDKAQPVAKGPFAAAYNRALLGACQAMDEDPDTDLSDLADQLMLGFWGGTRRRIRARSVTPGDIEFMALDTGDPTDEAEVKQDSTFRVTNLHSLNGLMFKVLERSQVPKIGAVRDLTIELSWSGGGTEKLKLSEQAAPALERVQEFFKTLGDVPADVLSDLTYQEAPGFKNRVYVDDQMIGFGAVQLGTGDGGAKQAWFRRRTERRAEPDFQSRLKDLSRLVVHFGRSENRAQDRNLPPVEGSMTFEVADVVECRLTRYRLGGATEPGAWLVARLSPTEGDRAQFERELEADKDGFGDKPLLDQEGKLLSDTQVRYLGCYRFPWEGKDPIPLFLVKSTPASDGGEGDSGVIGKLETVSVLLPRVKPDGDPIRVTLDPAGSRTKKEGMRDPTGPRWELPADSQLPDAEFELLRLVEPVLSPENQARLVVAAAFKDDAEFVFAHSAARYEGVIRVDYPEAKGDEAEREIREDLVNFNTLNVYHRWSALKQARLGVDDENRRELNTRFSELFPFWSEGGERHAASVAFQYLFKQPVQSPPGDLEGVDIRRYFDALYQAAGTQRRLDFRLEHTYGSELDLGQDVALACPLDSRPLLPPQVASPWFNQPLWTESP